MVRTRPWWLLVCFAFTAAADSPQTLTIEFDTEALAGRGISLEGLSARLAWPAGFLELAVQRLQLGEGSPLSDVRLECLGFELDATRGLGCDEGRLSFDHPLASARDMPVSLHWHPDHGGDVHFAEVPLAGRAVSAQIRRREDAWAVTVEASGTDLSAVGAALPITGLEISGQADVHAELEIAAGHLRHIDVKIVHNETRFQDATAAYLGEGLAGRVTLTMEDIGERWQGSLEGRWISGEVLTPVAYLQTTSANPLTVSARMTAKNRGSGIDLESFRVTQRPWINIDGRAGLDLSSPPLVRQLEARLADMDAGAAYARYFEPVMIHPLLTALQLSGRAAGRVRLKNGKLTGLQIELQDLAATAETDTARFSVAGLDSQVDLGPGTTQSGTVQWQSARVYDFAIGAARFPLAFGENTLATRATVTIPVLDGALEIERFALDWNRTPPDITFDALLLPVAMEEVTRALGWIPMKGQLSGVLPRVAISRGALQVGGNLLVQVFDGTVVVRNLKTSDLFGYWPVLTADAECAQLDLEMLTGTYEFGRITGRVDGVVEGLRLENWRPTAFDARFETTPGDRSRHRISQRAVDNLTSLSGGPTGALSRTFLRFFDEFNYDRLGIACRLRNGVCQMDGVEAAETGYYLVKGGGIPRIDVIGFNRSIDWDLLVGRLLAITESGPPLIE